MQWFRFYHEALDDEKVQLLPCERFKQWVNLLCLANQQKVRGSLPPIQAIAFRMRLTIDDAIEMIDYFESADFIDSVDGVRWMHNWSGRQKRSDDVAARVAEHRERAALNEESNDAGNDECNVTDPLPETFLARALEADAEAELETELEPEETPAAAREIEPFELTMNERQIVARIKSVPGLAHASDADVALCLREVLADRTAPVSERALLADAARFRDHWIEERSKAPPGKWKLWRKAVRNWFERTKDIADERPATNGTAAHSGLSVHAKLYDEPGIKPLEQGRVRHRITDSA